MNSQHEIVTFNVGYIPFVRDQFREALVSEIPFGMWFSVRILGKSGKCHDECSLTQWPLMFTGSGASLRFPRYEIHFFLFVLNKGLRRKKWCICLSQLMRKCRIFLITLCFEKWTLSAKTDAQFERCELSFILGKMSTAAQETASQRTLRNCSKETVG